MQTRRMREAAVLLLLLGSFCSAQNQISECGGCDDQSCEPPVGCKAGLVRDRCDCCYVCGLKEGERCDHPELNVASLGRCGDNLECRIRNDLSWQDPPEAVCICIHQKPLCGSDGVTYENVCQLTEARYRRRDGLRAVSREPCRKPPKIVTSPIDIRNVTGSYAAFTCEVRAWPLPEITWEVRKAGSIVALPGNSSDVGVQSRSGPAIDEMTSWLLFRSLAPSHSGEYRCRAENVVGSASASARVEVLLE